MSRHRILFVEDNHVLNMATSDSLTELGFEVESVYSATAAIAAINRLEYITVLLTDVDLPPERLRIHISEVGPGEFSAMRAT